MTYPSTSNENPASRLSGTRSVGRGAVLGLVSGGPPLLVAPLVYSLGASWTDVVTILAGGAIFLFPYLWMRWSVDSYFARAALLVGAMGLVVGIISTGLFFGQTFEAFTTPRYAALFWAGKDPYATLLSFSFRLCAGPSANGLVVCSTHLSQSYYVYLPELAFFQIPGLPYPWVTALAWAGTVYLVRDRPVAFAGLASPYVAILAANGYNDFPALFLLTLGWVGLGGRAGWIAKSMALGMKQFANVVIIVYFLVLRDWRGVAFTLVITAAFVLPYYFWNPGAYSCVALPHLGASCASGPFVDPLGHLNYWLWPLWVVVVYPRGVRKILARLLTDRLAARIL